MWRSWLKFFSVVAAIVFIWNFDRFGERIFVNFIFVAFAPSKAEVQNVPTAVIKVDHFPHNFSFGVSTSAFQIEGGWNEDGKTPSVWDTFTHEHSDLIADGSNADITTDSYHLYKKDVEALNQVGVNKLLIDNILPNLAIIFLFFIQVSALPAFVVVDKNYNERISSESEGN